MVQLSPLALARKASQLGVDIGMAVIVDSVAMGSVVAVAIDVFRPGCRGDKSEQRKLMGAGGDGASMMGCSSLERR